MNADSPLAARVVLGIVAAMAISIPLGITFNEARQLALLQETAQVTQGSVTGTRCENHGKLSYAYEVDEKRYRGSGTLLGRSCESVRVGDNIDIIYSTRKPQLSRSDSLESWQGRISGRYYLLAVVSLAAVIIIFRITHIDVDPLANARRTEKEGAG